MLNTCPTCNFKNKSEHQYCTQCGSKLHRDEKIHPRLVILNNQTGSTIFALNGGRSTLGRDIVNSIVLDDEQVSKHHAAIYFENGYYWIEDLDSKNGVYLNGSRITGRKRLYEGSLIKLGSKILRFEGSR
jgi:pSer/pThr/pTyr-binding forkhead associated (FHA) protein